MRFTRLLALAIFAMVGVASLGCGDSATKPAEKKDMAPAESTEANKEGSSTSSTTGPAAGLSMVSLEITGMS